MKNIKIACIGAGYFAHFHVEAWKRIPEVELVAICDQQMEKAQALADQFQVGKVYASMTDLLANENLDAIDIITPPPSHHQLCKQAAENGLAIICQKPLAPSLTEAKEIVQFAQQQGVRLMVHENFRFPTLVPKNKSTDRPTTTGP